MTHSGFPTYDLTSPNTEEDIVPHTINLPDLMNQICELLQTSLNHLSMTVMQEKLLLKQRSSYYYTIVKDHLRPQEDQQESTSVSFVKSHLGPDRLQGVTRWASSQVMIFLTYLEMLLQKITINRQNLEAFIAKWQQVGVDVDEVVSAEQQLQQVQQHMTDFETRMARSIEPLTLNSLFLLQMRNSFLPRVQMLVVDRGPVMFHRDKLLISPNSVYLFWYIAGEQSEEPQCVFEVVVKTPSPHIQILREAVCLNYEYGVENLMPDTCYTFTISRVFSSTRVYQRWTDTLTLRTLSSGPPHRTEHQRSTYA